ncbi:MAG: helix-turn-helix domain-containing protein [Thermoprotei archaeon]
MLNQVLLRVNNQDAIRDLADHYGVSVSVVDCKFFSPQRMALFLEMVGGNMEGFLNALRVEPSVKKVFSETNSSSSAWAVIVLDTPVYCRVARENGVFCLSCPMNHTVGERHPQPAKWKVLVASRQALRRSVEQLAESGVRVELGDTVQASVKLSGYRSLSPHQRDVLRQAYDLGYFDFPRKITLRRLAQKLGVKPSSLSEVLRRAQSKIVSRFFEYES